MVALGLVASAGASGTPGVTPTQVNVGAVVTQTGFLSADFQPYLYGVQAYFNYVNTTLHGVNGRQVVLSDIQDDQSNPTDDVTETRALATNSNIFGIVGYATAFFDGHDLAHSVIPTFGYATSNAWAGPKNFFADYGSKVDYASSLPDFAYIAKEVGATKIGVLSYPASIAASSYDECDNVVKNIKKTFGFTVAYSNLDDEVFSSTFASDVTKMKNDDVNMVISCMQASDDITLGQDMQLGAMPTVPQVWLDGYDRTLLSRDYNYMPDVYLLVQHVPFEANAAYPGKFPGLDLYFTQMSAYFQKTYGSNASQYDPYEYDDVALMGWQSANTFVQGLRAAGKNPTRATVIADINKMTKDLGGPPGYGVTSPINWKVEHSSNPSPGCITFVKTADTTSSSSAKFQLAFNNGSDPWVCFPLKGKVNLSKPVKAPAGTPGA
jgi:branched-chain amino acid transport system substrate-binding protein